MELLDTPVLPVKMEQARQGGDMLHPVVPNCVRSAAVSVDVGGRMQKARDTLSAGVASQCFLIEQAPWDPSTLHLLSPPDVRARLAMAKTPV